MLHPRLTPVGASIGGSSSAFLAAVSPYGAWSELTLITRWGDGACGNFELSFKMPLPAAFSHPLLRRGTLVELMDGPYRVGSPFIMSEPSVGSGLDNPWQITCVGIGREVEGDSTFLALDSLGNTNNIGTTVVDQAILRGWRIDGRDPTIPAGGVSTLSTTDDLKSVGAVLTEIAQVSDKRWGVRQDNFVSLLADPVAPTWQVTPDTVELGTADDDYATVVYGRYYNSGAGNALATVTASTSAANTQTVFGRKEYPADLTAMGPMPTGNAQIIVNTILAKSRGRLAWTNGLTLTSNELLSIGGVPAALSMVEAGQMVRLNGISNDLLEYNGQTWLDIIIGETRYVDGAQTITINPLGLAARDLASITEAITGQAA